jgi:acyl-CoA synthetase (AMP-forming)/AMP-acid ligase II
MNIYDTLFNSIATDSDKPAVTGQTREYSYAGLYQYAGQIAAKLSGFKAGNRPRVILYLEDSAEFVAAFYGVNMAGGVVVPVSPQTRDLKLQELIQHSEAAVMITSQRLLDAFRGIERDQIVSLKEILLVDDVPDAPATAETPATDAAVLGELAQAGYQISGVNFEEGRIVRFTASLWDEQELAALFYLTDPSGKPKGIMLSTRNILSNMEAIIEYLEMSSADKLLVLKSMSLVGTVTGEILAGIAVGATIVVLSGAVHAGIILKAIEDYKVTGFFSVPMTLHQIIEYKRKEKYSTESLRYIQTGAAKLLKEDVEQLLAMYPGVAFYYIYGLSEASPRVLHLKPEDMLRKVGSVGRPVKYCTVNLMNANLQPSKTGEIGEIYVQGPNVMLGYYKSPELTQKTLTPYGLKTGDLAYLDEEDYVYLAGRADNMINQGGFHVYPAEIERTILKFVKVKSVKVAGVPDELLGQKIKATVTPQDDITLTEVEVYDYCYSHLESAKIPKIIEVNNEIN